MENYICINGNKVELTEEQIKQLGFEVKKSLFERVANGKIYYRILTNGDVDFVREASNDRDNRSFSIANYCTDKALMEQRALHETLNRLLWRYSMEHDGDKIDWNDLIVAKYKIDYNLNTQAFSVDRNVLYMEIGAVYFHTGEIAQNAIKEVIEPFMKEHPEFKW